MVPLLCAGLLVAAVARGASGDYATAIGNVAAVAYVLWLRGGGTRGERR